VRKAKQASHREIQSVTRSESVQWNALVFKCYGRHKQGKGDITERPWLAPFNGTVPVPRLQLSSRVRRRGSWSCLSRY
jgi:hypothetical protein